MKKSRTQQLTLEVIVGLFVVGILGFLFYMTVLLSPTMFRKTHDMTVEFENVTGLLNGDKVYLQGVDVGRVKGMEITNQLVEVTLMLKYPVILHRGYRISVESSSVLGGRYVAINEGPATNAEVATGEKIVGTQPIDFIAEASEAVKSVRSALEEGGILSNLKQTLADARNIADDLKAGKGTMGKLLKSDEAYDNLITVETNLVAISDKINHGDGTVARLINDDSIYTNAEAIVTNLKDVSERLNKGEGTLGRLLSKDDQMYRDLASASSNINVIASNIAQGKGTLGKLAMDDALYNDLRSMIGEVRAAVDDLRETSPVASFASVMVGAF